MQTYFYPNRMGRIMLQALEEVIGSNGINAVLKHASLTEYIHNYPSPNQDLKVPFEAIAQIQSALEDTYGPRGGRGLALRAGRTCFKYGLREFGPELGFTDLTFRLLPLPMKIKTGIQAFSDLFNQFSDQRVRVELGEGCILWQIERCPLCWQRQTRESACHLAVGLLQEALYWVSGGKIFSVEEISCIARGDPACTILINQNPLN